MSNIIEDLKGMVTSQLISKASNLLGESESGISKAVGGMIPTLLGGLLQKSSDSSSFGSIFNMLKDDRNAGFLNNLDGLLGGGNLSQGDPKDIAGGLMGSLFGSKVGGILDTVSSFAGIKKSSTSSLLGLVGPMVMGYFGRKIKNEGLSLSGLTSLLGSQKSNIMSALPAGLGSMLGFADFGKSIPNVPKAPVVNTDVKGDSFNWWPWLLGLLALAAIIYFWRGCNKPDVEGMVEDTTSAVSNAADSVGATVTNAADNAADAVSGLGSFFSKKLACGVELNIPERGIEANMVTFIEDASKPVDKTTWFNFDRLTFETAKATLDMAKSEEQLKNIAEIMKCYPKVKLKIGGYTDNVGDAKANMKLSQNRANNVRDALVAIGVAAGRLEAEGYGDQHAVATNDTEEGRAQNRRIASRVMEK